MFTNVEMFTVILACAKTLASFPAPPQLFKIGGEGGGQSPCFLRQCSLVQDSLCSLETLHSLKTLAVFTCVEKNGEPEDEATKTLAVYRYCPMFTNVLKYSH